MNLIMVTIDRAADLRIRSVSRGEGKGNICEGFLAAAWVVELLFCSDFCPVFNGPASALGEEEEEGAEGLRSVSIATMARAASWLTTPRSSTSASDMLRL